MKDELELLEIAAKRKEKGKYVTLDKLKKGYKVTLTSISKPGKMFTRG